MTQTVNQPTHDAPLLPGLDGAEQLTLAPVPVTETDADEATETPVCEGQTTVYDMLTEPGV